jgi:nucleoid-associated protein YgaU
VRRGASTAAGATALRPVPAPAEPVRPKVDVAALRRTRLPLIVVLLAIAIFAGFAAGPWALKQLTGGAVPTPSAAAGALASAAPSAQPTVPPTPVPSAAASPEATPLSSPQPSARPAFYIVQRGDSLGSIANRFGTTVQRLMDLNHISNPNRINVGQKILLPAN